MNNAVINASPKAVSFSGYRPEKLPDGGNENMNSISALKADLVEAIDVAISRGYDTFIVGMAEGFDMFAAEAVIAEKSKYDNIKLIAAIPFDDGRERSERYKNIIEKSDKIVTLADEYNRGTYYTRNEYMVDNSSLIICYYYGRYGGTEYTIEYAQKKGKEVVNIAPKKQKGMGGVEIFNNTTNRVRDDLERTIRKDSKVSIAAACFSIFAYQELKRRLNKIDKLRFIFTSPTFTTEKAKKEKREFYIPQLSREKSLYGTEFEVKLRNELTQKAIAKECAEWIERKATFKSNITNDNMGGFINVESDDKLCYMPINGFTTVDIGCEKGNNIYNMVSKFETPMSNAYFSLFDEIWNDNQKLQDVTQEVIDNITTVYKENSAEYIYFVTLYNIFNEFLEDISEDVLPNEATGFKESEIWKKLYNFQKDAALAIINKLEKFNGCILADSVGLGKTFTALAVIKYYENRNKSVLVLCPKKLHDNWITYRGNLLNNPVAKDRLRYDVLYHTDLSRDKGVSNGIPLDRLNWGNYDLVVIDESHNFRNGGQTYGEDGVRENRYLRLLNKVIRQGVKTKVLMLSATPVNNRFVDLKNQISLAYEGDAKIINKQLNTKRGIDDIFRLAQGAFNTWSDFPVEKRTTENLLKMLDFDFFEVLDSVTIARSRKHIEKYYDMQDMGTFPERNKPISLRSPLTTLNDVISFDEIYTELSKLNMSIYSPSAYIFDSKMSKYDARYGSDMGNAFFKQADREQGIMKLMRINLLKRLESSVHSFRLTLSRILEQIDAVIETINSYSPEKMVETLEMGNIDEFDLDDQNSDMFTVGKKVRIELGDMDYKTWLADLILDRDIIANLLLEATIITPDLDAKLLKLCDEIRQKIQNPINDSNKKVIVFSAFSDTALYLYEHISVMVKKEFNLETAMVTGDSNKMTIDKKAVAPYDHTNINTILTLFSPISKEKELIMQSNNACIDILIATDCISEGQNLQDCDYLVNYDIHWNPVRIIQRFGRIDRIGSRNKKIQLVNFWPDLNLDEYIKLKSRVETRMKISVMTSTGDDNPIDDDKGDLEYRRNQLERLQNEVVDIEEMSGGISIMDLGLNEFRLDLLNYIKDDPDIEKCPFGMHAVVDSTTSGDGRSILPSGVIYILKNINNQVNIDSQNRLHPFYMVYICDDGEVYHNHLEPKKLLDTLRYLCKNRKEPISSLCKTFNEETKDGRDMGKYSTLLENTISSITQVKEESDIDSFFSMGETTALENTISGLHDFELICFLVVK